MEGSKPAAPAAAAAAAAKTTTTMLNPDEIDKILAREMNELSFKDRNTIQEDIHCIKSTCIEESPQLIESSLLGLEEEIHAIPNIDRTAYNDALITDNTYIQSKDFCLMFLRASLFNVKKAAWRLVRYTELLFELYGLEVLKRPLQLSDLNKKEQEEMRAGCYQILPTRDRAGRLVAFFRPNTKQGLTNVNRIRMILYIFTTMAEDVETQKKGHVSISMYGAEDLVSLSREKDHELYTTLVEGIPVRFTASHFCLTSGSSVVALARAFVYFAIADKDIRPRVKFYNGLGLDTQYHLMGLGIPVADLPISNTMTIKTKNHHRWIKTRKMLEEARSRGQSTSHWIEYPGNHDVLFRRGGNLTKQGNLEFTTIIEAKMDAYFTGSAITKDRIRDEIINMVQANGGKFLEYNRQTDLWVQIQDTSVLNDKIYSALYDHNRRMSAKQPRQQSNCHTDSFIEANKRRKLGQDTCCD